MTTKTVLQRMHKGILHREEEDNMDTTVKR
jgi:hypothetical protein